jgi:hypothetical protein
MKQQHTSSSRKGASLRSLSIRSALHGQFGRVARCFVGFNSLLLILFSQGSVGGPSHRSLLTLCSATEHVLLFFSSVGRKFFFWSSLNLQYLQEPCVGSCGCGLAKGCFVAKPFDSQRASWPTWPRCSLKLPFFKLVLRG